ncbi:MAG: hypothetical protein LBO65_02825 [Spirochaetaceae bacterium]|nr:hypothetical protein [Spirochaetaceae bacterium]
MKNVVVKLFPAVLGIFVLAGCAKVTGVTLTPPSFIARGGTAQFTAAVEGTGNPSQKIKWEITETVAEGTSVSEEGLLTVAQDEPAMRLTVRAVSAANKNVSAEVPVLLTDALYGAWLQNESTHTFTTTLSADSLTGRYRAFSGSGMRSRAGYTVENLSWTPVVMDAPNLQENFPLGYLINGTIVEAYNVSDMKKGGSFAYTFYPHVDGSMVLRFSLPDPDGSMRVNEYMRTKIEEE